MSTTKLSTLPNDRAAEYSLFIQDLDIPPSAETGYYYTKHALKLFKSLKFRVNNPIPGAKTGKKLLETVAIDDVRRFLVELPFPLLETLLSGELDTTIMEEYGPNPLIPYPCIYIGQLVGKDEPLTSRLLWRIAEVLNDPEETRQAVFRSYNTNAVEIADPIGGMIKIAAMELAEVWFASLEKEGLDGDTVDDATVAAWDQDVPFKIAYCGYSNTPSSRFKSHSDWSTHRRPKSLGHVICAVAHDLAPDAVEWTGTAVWAARDGDWAKGKLAEFFLSEIVSVSAGVYAWEGGMNVNVFL
jgi:hypothetical protein